MAAAHLQDPAGAGQRLADTVRCHIKTPDLQRDLHLVYLAIIVQRQQIPRQALAIDRHVA